MKVRRIYKYTFYLTALIIALSSAIIFNGCQNKKGQAYVSTGNDITDGENLVKIHCTRCHALVPTDALTKDVWFFHTLPSMAPKLGLIDYGGGQYYQKDSTSVISLVDWMKIVAYYKKMAPDKLAAVKRPVPLQKDWSIFKLKKPKSDSSIAYTTMVAADPYSDKIYTSDLLVPKLYEWDTGMKPRFIQDLRSTAVNADFIKNTQNLTTQGVFSCIGAIDDVESDLGNLIKISDLSAKESQLDSSNIASYLPRPVHAVHADFNKDGLPDWVVSCEGHNTGGLYLFTQTAKHTFTQTVIRNVPGAVQSVVTDLNNDGWPDIMALFGKGDEGIWTFINDHQGGFKALNVLRFPPVYGSSSFQLVDFNHDGKLDILYTCGNNFGDSRILKPYHGVYIFLNQGNYKFTQSYFYPINGCTKAIAADFENNGKVGIAASAFFADLKDNPSEGCVYFEPQGPLSFKPHAIPVNMYGRWKCMDIKNHNGKIDIILGNYSKGFKIQDMVSNWNTHLPFIVLENTSKNHGKN